MKQRKRDGYRPSKQKRSGKRPNRFDGGAAGSENGIVNDGTRRLDAAVRERFLLSWAKARDRITRGKIHIEGVQVLDIGHLLAEGVDFEYVEATPRRPSVPVHSLPPEAIVHIDDDLVVVDKPAGLLSVPLDEYTEYEPKEDDESLVQLLSNALESMLGKGQDVFVVHRLDRGTSGVLVFARNRIARDRLKDQFRVHSVHRCYLALVEGHVASTTIENHLVRDRGDGVRGSVENAPLRMRRKLSGGRIAITHVEALEMLREATLIACRLETGRTNQIRIHLSELGHPLVGETVYRRSDGRSAKPARRLCLHAAELGFIHPRSGEHLHFKSEVPSAMQQEIDGRR
ncbi:MAG: hypothetical protein A2341_19070 [Deltaproteobacteria bacterium RIFOXYB12_FULL_58_9]|nr:MAG: hypothetical protein A2341_19070 [Deltaproteobacteria bacterium RIFOXYB12_FULL_58_9]